MKKVDWKTLSHFEGPEQSPGFLLWQVSSQWRRLIEEALSTLGLTHPQFVLLASLGWLTRHRATISQVELAQHCKMDISMTSQVLRSLEQKGHIKRLQMKGNERSKFPCLTPSGSQLIEKAIPLVEQIDKNFFQKLDSDVGKCLEILKRLV